MKLIELKRMYDFYNKTLFSGRLVNDVSMVITAARKYYGAAVCYYEGDGTTNRTYKIHFAKQLERCRHPDVNYHTIMIHEMIHIFQYMTYPQKVMMDKGAAEHDKIFFNWLDMIEYQHGIKMYRDFQV